MRVTIHNLFYYREHSKEFFTELNKDNIPILVFSAGLGDIVVAVLEHCGVLLPNVEVSENYLNSD